MKIITSVKPDSTITLSVTFSLCEYKQRIDAYISEQFPHYSRSFFQRLINKQYVTLNNVVVDKAKTLVTHGDVIRVYFPPNRTVSQQDLAALPFSVDVVFEHPHFYIINKPAGLLVHPPNKYVETPTLVDWLLHKSASFQHVGHEDRPGIVHRLDRDTSGLMIVPRTNFAFTTFSTMFKERSIKKTYLALVHGHPDKKGIIDLPIGRHPYHKNKMCTFAERQKGNHTFPTSDSTKQRPSVSHYCVRDYFSDSSLVEVKPVTGRTHQIRIHCASAGFPLVGDNVYYKESRLINRHALHAYGLQFTFMDTPYTFTQDPPQDFKDALNNV